MAIKRSVEYNVKSTGGEDTKAAVDAITSALTESGEAAKKTAKSYDAVSAEATKLGKDVRGIGSLFHQIGYAMAGQETPSKKFVAMLSASRAGFDSLTKGIKDFGGVIAGAAGLFGPYGMLLGGIVSSVKALWDLFSDPIPPATATDALDKQSAAADRLAQKLAALGGTVDAMTARRMLKLEDEIKAENAAYADAAEKVAELQSKYVVSLQLIDEKRRTLMTKAQFDARGDLHDYDAYVKRELKGLEESSQAAYKEWQKAIDIIKEGDIRAAVKADLEAEKEAIEAIKLATAATDAALKKAAEERQNKAKAEAEKRKAQYKADQDALNAIVARGEDVRWAMTEHTALETTNRDIERRKKDASDKIKDAKMLQEALNQIEIQGILERERAMTQDAKKREDFLKALSGKLAAAQSLSPMGGGELTEEQRVRDAFEKDQEIIKRSLEQTRDALQEIEKLSQEEQIAFLDQKRELLAQVADLTEQSALRERQLIRDVELARKKAADDAHKANLKQIHDAVALSDANKEAMNSTVEGMNIVAAAMEQWGVGAGKVQALEMTASGIKAGADAIDYAAESAAAFANFQYVRGAALAAASIAKTTSAAAYLKGAIELGANGFELPTAAEVSTGGTSSGGAAQKPSTSVLTGTQGGAEARQTIDINLLYSGGGPELANALIRGLNANANNSGMARINARLIAR